jgi:hypothetical protein
MRLARAVFAGLVVAVLVGGWAARARGWSLLHPFSADPPETQSAKPAAKPAPKPTPKPAVQPSSTAGKAASSNKSFLGSVGDTLSFKKTPPKKTAPSSGTFNPAGTGTTTVTTSKAPSKSTSFWSSLNPFHHDEPKKPQTPQDFVGMRRPN